MQKYFWDATIAVRNYTYYPARYEFISRDSIFRDWVIVLAEHGAFEWETSNDKGKLIHGTAGFSELFCACPNAPFNRHVTTKTLAYHVFQWNFTDGHSELNNIRWTPGISPIRNVPRFTSTLEMLKPLFGKSDAWSKKRQAHLLEELLHLAWQTRNEPAQITDNAMNEAAQLLRGRAGESFSMEEISTAFHLSAVQFTRRFRAAHGCNPIKFLTQVRLEKAQRLLIETSLPANEIAHRCGWASGVYLSHIFKRLLSTTPGEFRATHRL